MAKQRIEITPELSIEVEGHAVTIRTPDTWVWLYVSDTASRMSIDLRTFDPKNGRQTSSLEKILVEKPFDWSP